MLHYVKNILREPLVHFLLLGAGLFMAFGLVDNRIGGAPGKIVVTQAHIEHLQAGFRRVHGRPASAEELEGLIGDFVREEVYYREALALGMDRDDTVIRNRLRLKMEFISDDVAAQAEPTDEQLRNYMRRHPDAFRVAGRFTFSHVYLNPERRRDSLESDAVKLLSQLNQAGTRADVSELGDPFLLDQEFDSIPQSEVAKLFGEKFATQLSEAAPGRWQGPVESGYGVHLVLVSARPEGRLPALEEMRDAVRLHWLNAQRIEIKEKLYQTLLQRYHVAIERPQPKGGEKKLAVVSR